ncbi:hypothetical protein [Ignicoccus hospitalis]|uniref:Uncharacterized protein n=1 Tax=Ignicoccus hospitalis (strain KIN4/I / DSM 18386 / JCM 14125) TaxID=453591 RepID=A8AA68_IGNH4|nr:hypothetical protein [Ignicoccus hospitalis]ABU81820.1 hypothetical protein Igni_0638 [Ignicoccus hospitalis KIN4/I]HIH90089.1 hypothetical protein [Desulfurococcaceae archaeon]
MTEITLINCANAKTVHVRKGRIEEGEGGELFDCKGMPVKTLRCTVALKPFKRWEELLEDPVPEPEWVDSLLVKGVGAAIAPKGTRAALVEVVERPFVLDPLAPPEEVPERGAVVARSLDADSSYGYKLKYGKWPVEDLGDKASNNIILNPFWVTTWEIKKIKIASFMPEMVALGTSSPIPPELRKAVLSPLTGRWGPDALEAVATLLMRSHYWSGELRAQHDDASCWSFLGKEGPRLAKGSKAMLWVGHEEAELVVTGDQVLFREELLELKSVSAPSPLL